MSQGSQGSQGYWDALMKDGGDAPSSLPSSQGLESEEVRDSPKVSRNPSILRAPFLASLPDPSLPTADDDVEQKSAQASAVAEEKLSGLLAAVEGVSHTSKHEREKSPQSESDRKKVGSVAAVVRAETLSELIRAASDDFVGSAASSSRLVGGTIVVPQAGAEEVAAAVKRQDLPPVCDRCRRLHRKCDRMTPCGECKLRHSVCVTTPEVLLAPRPPKSGKKSGGSGSKGKKRTRDTSPFGGSDVAEAGVWPSVPSRISSRPKSKKRYEEDGDFAGNASPLDPDDVVEDIDDDSADVPKARKHVMPKKAYVLPDAATLPSDSNATLPDPRNKVSLSDAAIALVGIDGTPMSPPVAAAPMGCDACRLTNKRCNRETPCSSCLAEGKQDLCKTTKP